MHILTLLALTGLACLATSNAQMKQGKPFEVTANKGKTRPVYPYLYGNGKGPVLMYLVGTGSSAKNSSIARLWTKGGRPGRDKLVNNGNFVLLLPACGDNDCLSDIMDSIDGSKEISNKKQRDRIQVVKDRYDPSVPVVVYGESAGCAKLNLMLFTMKDPRLTRFGCFVAQLKKPEVKPLKPGSLATPAKTFWIFNAMNDTLVPFFGGRPSKGASRGDFVSAAENAELWAKAFAKNQESVSESVTEEPSEPAVVGTTLITKHSYLDGQVTYWSYNNLEAKVTHYGWRNIQFSYAQLAKLASKTL